MASVLWEWWKNSFMPGISISDWPMIFSLQNIGMAKARWEWWPNPNMFSCFILLWFLKHFNLVLFKHDEVFNSWKEWLTDRWSKESCFTTQFERKNHYRDNLMQYSCKYFLKVHMQCTCSQCNCSHSKFILSWLASILSDKNVQASYY